MKSNQSNRILKWQLILVFLLNMSSIHAAENAEVKEITRKPNLIFILADDLGYGELGCYGQTLIKTPNIDRLASEGMRFTQCYAGSTVCAPSRASLMTGLHTGHVRIRGNSKMSLETEDVTVAEVLKKAGYVTGAVGKWGLGLEGSPGTPNKKGFDEWFGFLDQTLAHNYYPELVWRNENQFPLMDNFKGAKKLYIHNFFTRAATNFVRLHKDEPFFLYLAYTIPHANNELKEKGMEVPNAEPYTKENWPEPDKNKAAMITRLDTDVGKLMALLREYNLEQDTVVFFSSDNGPHKEGGANPAFFKSSGALRGIKRDLYEGGIRVPMIVRWKGKIEAGKVNSQPWAFWDVLPTAAAIAGAKAPEKIDGISMLPTLLGKKQEGHEFFYWEFHEGGSKQAVRMGDWKAVRLNPGGPLELYNLTTDTSEKTNVAKDHPDVIEKIENYLKTARTESTTWPLKEGKTPSKTTKTPANTNTQP